MSSLEESPEKIQAEIDRDADIIGDESLIFKFGREGDESVEHNDDAEESEGRICEIRLERRLEDEGIPINALGLERSVEFDVCHRDGGPGEKSGDGGQILEPGKDGAGTSAG